jgi:hypothetical protein
MKERHCSYCGTSFKPYIRKQVKCQSKECAAAWRKEYQHRYYLLNTDKAKAQSKQWRLSNPAHSLWKGARRRAREMGLEFTIEPSDINIPMECPILKVPLTPRTRYAPSLDRKEPSKGYVKDNIWVISKLANQMKSNSTLQEQRKFAEWVRTLEPSQKISIAS